MSVLADRVEALEGQVKQLTGKLETLVVQFKGLLPVRQAVEWLGKTVEGQTEVLNIVVEELGAEFGQKVTANHAKRQEERRQQVLNEQKQALQNLIDGGMVETQETVSAGTLLIGNVTKDGKIVQEFEAGVFENFPQPLQEAVTGKTVGATWEGPKGVFELKQIFAFKKAPAVVENLAQDAATETPATEVYTDTGPTSTSEESTPVETSVASEESATTPAEEAPNATESSSKTSKEDGATQ